jgi:hypothetical protein
MTQTKDIALLMPLVVGLCAFAATIVIHAIVLNVAIRFFRHERSLGRAGKSFTIDLPIVGLTIAFALAAHLIEIALWAFVLMICGQFTVLTTAYYHAALNYTTLGDVSMSPSWTLLGPLAAVDGMLMFGVSTAMIFAVVQSLTVTRYADLRD